MAQTQELPRIEPFNAYKAYQAEERIPVYGGFFIEDLKTVEVKDWLRRGGKGAFINLEGTGATNDAYVAEIPPGGSLAPQRQLYEELIYVLSGSGTTQVWYEGTQKITFEWGTGSVFTIPLNANHQHFNGSGTQPARYVAVTNAPTIMNLFHNRDFIFNCPYNFTDRFAGQSDYFSESGKLYQKRIWETNFVPDVDIFKLFDHSERGAGGFGVLFELGHNTMCGHISEFPIGTYKKAHRHGAGAHVIIISGVGHSILWPDGGEHRRVDWKPGSVVVPPLDWFHQHFNTGDSPARYLALRWGSRRYLAPPALHNAERITDVSVKEGGTQIEYDDESADIHRTFEEELKKHGAECRMGDLHPLCSARKAAGVAR